MVATMIAAYVAAALWFAVQAFRYGTGYRSREPFMTGAHTAALVAVAALAGAAWLLFAPPMLVRWIREARAQGKWAVGWGALPASRKVTAH